MSQMTYVRIAAAVLGLAVAGGQAAFSGQAPAPPTGTGPAAIGSGSFSPIVGNLQRTLAFYALLGIEVPEGTAVKPQPFSVNPRLHSMLGTNGANERHVNARVPGGFTLEPIEFDGDRPAARAAEDPGSGRHHARRLRARRGRTAGEGLAGGGAGADAGRQADRARREHPRGAAGGSRRAAGRTAAGQPAARDDGAGDEQRHRIAHHDDRRRHASAPCACIATSSGSRSRGSRALPPMPNSRRSRD